MLDHQDRFQISGKSANAARLQRPGHADLVKRKAKVPSLIQTQAHGGQGLDHILIGLALTDYAKPCRFAAKHGAVYAIGLGPGEGCGNLVLT